MPDALCPDSRDVLTQSHNSRGEKQLQAGTFCEEVEVGNALPREKGLDRLQREFQTWNKAGIQR